jgi:hypothetical protein
MGSLAASMTFQFNEMKVVMVKDSIVARIEELDHASVRFSNLDLMARRRQHFLRLPTADGH